MRIRSRLHYSAVLMLGLTTACGGDAAEEAETPAAETPAAEPAAPAPAAGLNTTNLPAGVTAEMVTEGQQIYSGAGICFTCHGQNGVGTVLAPNLADDTWLNIEAGPNLYESLVTVITTGVPQPMEAPAPMPPKGGGQLTDQQIRAVAAYVYALGPRS